MFSVIHHENEYKCKDNDMSLLKDSFDYWILSSYINNQIKPKFISTSYSDILI